MKELIKKCIYILAILLSFSGALIGCSSSKDSSKEVEKKHIGDATAIQLSSEVMECILNEDVEGLKQLFCSAVQNSHNLDKEISKALEFIDGTIIEYSTPDGMRGGGTKRDGEWVELSLKGDIANIKTSTGKTYSIFFHSYAIYKEDTYRLGITHISIFLEDEYDKKSGYPDDAKYIIGEVLE